MENETRKQILQNIFSNFQGASQWLPDNFRNSAECVDKATAFIELLEVEDCGSIGGYDNHNLLIAVVNWKLYNRFLTVLKKYNNAKDIKEECGFTPKTLGQCFTKIGRVRDKMQQNL